MLTQHFFLEGIYLGHAKRGLIRFSSSDFQLPLSKLFFCRVCGEVFAKCPIVSDTTGITAPFHSIAACCRKCRPESTLMIPGSISSYPEPEFLAAFPDAVLLWEVLRHLDTYPGNHHG